MKFFTWLGRSMEEAPGVPSSLRLIMVYGSVVTITTVCLAWLIACHVEGRLSEIPPGVSALFLGILGLVLTAKVVQSYGEAPATPVVTTPPVVTPAPVAPPVAPPVVSQ